MSNDSSQGTTTVELDRPSPGSTCSTRAIKDLRMAATWMRTLGFLVIAAGVIAGIIVALRPEFPGSAIRPYVGLGVGIGAGGLIYGAFLVTVGCFAEAWALKNKPAKIKAPA